MGKSLYHKNKTWGTLLMFLWAVVPVLAAQDSLRVVREIKWKSSSEFQYPELPFHGNGFYEEESGIPVVRISIPLPENYSEENSEITIQSSQWSAYEDSLVDITGEDVSRPIGKRIVYIRKKPWLEIEMVPFRKGEQSGIKWEKLNSFVVNINYTPASSAPRKSEERTYTNSSKLSEGHWVKIGTTTRGMHKIPYSKLEEWGFSNPSSVQIFGNPGAMVPMANDEERPDDLPAIGCLHKDNALFFYSPGPWRRIWDREKNILKHQLHKYSPTANFFLSETEDTVQEPSTSEPIEETADLSTKTYDYLYFHEEELENLLASGNQWFGEKFNASSGLERSFSFNIPNLLSENKAMFYSQVAGRSNNAHGFEININDEVSKTISVNTVSLNDHLGFYARIADDSIRFQPDPSDINISYRYTSEAGNTAGWLDYFIINARARLTLEHGPIVFRDRLIVGENNIATFNISTSADESIVWDVTNPASPRKMSPQYSNGQITFKDKADELKEYVAFHTDMSLPAPEFLEEVENQNLHATSPAEMIIITPPEFRSQANRLAALHTEHSNLKVTVAGRDRIYNEFSWGHPDPGAIRSFLKMLYDRSGDNSDQAPKLLLLFGDGTYDNRHVDHKPAAPLPTYQSDNSIYQTQTYMTDDFFCVLDDNEGSDLRNDRPDIGVGRFPVNTQEEAKNAVDKSEKYLTDQTKDRWKTRLTFVGDDGDFNLHMRDADRLTQKIARNQPQFNLNKIYFDAYEVASGSTGKEFPGVSKDIKKAISDGTLIFNYTGHGSENNLAHEKVVTKTDINNWQNRNKLPLFVTATCEFSRFDNHNHTSAGEEVFLNPKGGGIALLSTTRIVYSSLNFTLNNAFYNHVFEKDEKGRPLRLGEIMRRTKIEAGSNTNKLNFSLLGDPALRINYPHNTIETKAINNKNFNEEETDTIRAMSKNTIKAAVAGPNGETLSGFNGTAHITVYDKANQVTTLGNGSSEPFEYKEYSNVLFQGSATVSDGTFEASFVVPRDIRYNFDDGRISYYALSEDGREASGATHEFVVGGIAQDPLPDEDGPEIDMYLNHEGFNPGDNTGPRPMLHANVFDESGINTSGIGIGHNITLIIDGDTNNPVVLNDAFTASRDDFRQGTISYQLPRLENGKHELTLKVWDNYNNSSTATLTFRVNDDHGIRLRGFNAWPNPVKAGDDVFITFETDAPNSLIDATIQFIDASGKVTGVVEEELLSSGNQVGPYRLPMEQSGWNHSGICFVRVILETPNGEKTSAVAKLLPSPK
ncbi:MAG: type IX secretion system sortase PorU [Marinilabiliaceae bacterium]